MLDVLVEVAVVAVVALGAVGEPPPPPPQAETIHTTRSNSCLVSRHIQTNVSQTGTTLVNVRVEITDDKVVRVGGTGQIVLPKIFSYR